MSDLDGPILWLDLEMTGLDLAHDAIMEIALLVTDKDLAPLHEGLDLVVHVPEPKLSAMGEWCQEHHGKSGLTEACRKSTLSLKSAELQVLKTIHQWFPQPRVAQLAGNSVHVDRAFIRKYMPQLFRHLHHRIIDVSSFLVLAYRWYPERIPEISLPPADHRALSDVRRSIEHIRLIRKVLFTGKQG